MDALAGLVLRDVEELDDDWFAAELSAGLETVAGRPAAGACGSPVAGERRDREQPLG